MNIASNFPYLYAQVNPTTIVLPAGAPAWQYAQYNIQDAYVAPGGWQPSEAIVAEAQAHSETLERQVRMSTYF